MPDVIVVIEFQGKFSPEYRIDEETAKRRSQVLKAEIENAPAIADGSPKQVLVHGSFGPTGNLLKQIAQYGARRNFKIYSRDLAIEHVAMLWEVAGNLQVAPDQEGLRKDIRSWIAHKKAEPHEVVTLGRIFWGARDTVHPNDNSSMWDLLVHHVSYNLLHGPYTEEDSKNLQGTLKAQALPLAEAVDTKYHKLKRGQETHHSEQEKRMQKKATKTTNKLVAKHKAEQQERKEGEPRGERVLSEGAAKQVITRAPELWTATVTEGRHGKRNRPGEGKRSKKTKEEVTEEESAAE